MLDSVRGAAAHADCHVNDVLDIFVLLAPGLRSLPSL